MITRIFTILFLTINSMAHAQWMNNGTIIENTNTGDVVIGNRLYFVHRGDDIVDARKMGIDHQRTAIGEPQAGRPHPRAEHAVAAPQVMVEE